jgi:hypothetical protein
MEGIKGMRVVCVGIVRGETVWSQRLLSAQEYLSSTLYRNVFSTGLAASLFGTGLLRHSASLKLPVLICTDVEMNCEFAADT